MKYLTEEKFNNLIEKTEMCISNFTAFRINELSELFTLHDALVLLYNLKYSGIVKFNNDVETENDIQNQNNSKDAL